MPLHVAVLLLGLLADPAAPQQDAVLVGVAVSPNAAATDQLSLIDVAVATTPVDATDEGIVLPAQDAKPQDEKPHAGDSDQPDGKDQRPPDKADAKKPPTPPHTGIHALFSGLAEDVRHLPSKENGLIALAGGIGAAAVHPGDATVNERLRSHYTLVNDIYSPGKWVGQSPVVFGSAIVVYTLGRRNNQPKVSHFGMDLMRALIINEALTDVIKYATHRERPDNSDALSFPSGHSSTTFAAATVIERHLGWKYSVLGYTIASYVASSRLHDNRHWLSDVVFGAAVGTISGRTVTQHGRNAWTFAPVTVPGGVAVVVARTGS